MAGKGGGSVWPCVLLRRERRGRWGWCLVVYAAAGHQHAQQAGMARSALPFSCERVRRAKVGKAVAGVQRLGGGSGSGGGGGGGETFVGMCTGMEGPWDSRGCMC